MEEKRERLYCYDCKHCLVVEYNEWLDVYCLRSGARKPTAMFNTCEKVEERN